MMSLHLSRELMSGPRICTVLPYYDSHTLRYAILHGLNAALFVQTCTTVYAGHILSWSYTSSLLN